MAGKETGTGFGGVVLPTGPSEKELRWSSWWVDHREGVRKAAIGVFIAFDAVFLLIAGWGFVDWLAFGGVEEERAIRQFTSPGYLSIGGASAVRELQIGAPIVLQAGSGKIDILVPIENQNPDYWADVSYRVVVGGKEQPERKAFVLPGQAKYLVELGVATSGGSAEVSLARRAWYRAETMGAETVADFLETRLNVGAINAKFKPGDPLATTPSSSAEFILTNRTAFGYYDVDLLVLLYRGDAIVGVNKIRVGSLQAGEKKPMELFWYQILPLVSRVEVVPDINIYDESVYRSPAD